MQNPYTTRALFGAIAVEGLAAPYNTLVFKTYYPASFGDSELERSTGLVPANSQQAPFPVVILMPGMNIDPSGYSWLAKQLGEAGMVTLCYQFIAEEMPGYVNASPGIDLTQLKPDTYGSAPSSSTLSSIVAYLNQLQVSGTLAGQLDLDHIILGGHSAGGMMALLNANPDWFNGISGCFSYGAHSGVSTLLGWPENTLLPLPNKVPLLLMGGKQDGCIANSNQRYEKGGKADPCQRISDSFDQALGNQNGNNLLVFFEGANHFTPVHPQDHTTGRSFIDTAVDVDQNAQRDLLAETIIRFIQQKCISEAPAAAQEDLLAFLRQQPQVASARHK